MFLFSCSEVFAHILLYSRGNVTSLGSLIKLLTCDMLIEFYVSIAHTFSIFVGDFRHSLARFVHKVVLYEPLTHKLFRKLFLWFALFQLLFVAVGIEVSTGIGSMYLVDEIHLAVAFTKLILGIDKDKPLTGSYLLATSKDLA